LNIQLHYSPAGVTDKHQPLGRVTFGVVISRARRPFTCRVETNRAIRRIKTEAVKEMIQAWKEVPEDVVWEGWDFDEEWEAK
jgi:hypothetical protein